jgi:hypothetical protein
VKRFILLLLSICWLFLVLGLDIGSAAEIPAVEQKKIEILISKVERMTDAAFIRNGTSYSASLAADFLRRKWRAHGQEIKSALDFIEKVASYSSHSGKPYSIRWSDGREKLCGEFLKSQLYVLEGRS